MGNLTSPMEFVAPIGKNISSWNKISRRKLRTLLKKNNLFADILYIHNTVTVPIVEAKQYRHHEL